MRLLVVEDDPDLNRQLTTALSDAGYETVMVNYRVQGDRYIVDTVFDKAILIAGVGKSQDRITIQRGKRSCAPGCFSRCSLALPPRRSSPVRPHGRWMAAGASSRSIGR